MRLSRQVTIGLCAAVLLAFAACEWAYTAVEGKFERSLNVTGPVDLDVTTGSGKIDVRAGSPSVVQIYATIRANDDGRSSAQDKIRYLTENPPIEQTGNTVRIGRIDNEAYRNNVSISYEIVAPAETRLRSKTGSGSQKVEGLQGPADASTGSGSIAMYSVGGDVIAHTGSGGIDLDQVAGRVEASTGSGSIRAQRIAGAIRANTGSGSVTLEQTSAERGGVRDVEVSTGSGSIEVSGVSGPLRAESGSGHITISGDPAGDWKVQASSGGVTLHLNRDAAFDLYAHASSGRITVDHPLTVTGTLSRHEMRGKVRGGGNLIEIRTSSGGITIQ